MLKRIKSFFSPVRGGRTSFASQNGNIQRKEGQLFTRLSFLWRKWGERYLISSHFGDVYV